MKNHDLTAAFCMQLSNFDGLSGYIFGSKGKEGIAGQFQKQVSKPFSKDLESIVEEHTSWLESNCERQLGNYRQAQNASSCQTTCEP